MSNGSRLLNIQPRMLARSFNLSLEMFIAQRLVFGEPLASGLEGGLLLI
jgi:hypothetical protein